MTNSQTENFVKVFVLGLIRALFSQKPVRKFSEVFNIFGHGNDLGNEYQRSRSLCPTIGCCKGHIMFWLSICARMPMCVRPSVPV